MQLCGSWSILWHCLFGIGMKTDHFQSCGHCWVFQICWHIECSTFTASSFRIWNSSIGIPSPPLALFIVMLFISAKSLQSCLTLCAPVDGSLLRPWDSPQARTLKWVAISFSNAWKWKVKVKSLSRVWFFEILWTAAYQAPPSMGVFRQEYWSGLPLPSPFFFFFFLSLVNH